MKAFRLSTLLALHLFVASAAFADVSTEAVTPAFKKVLIVVLENTDADDASRAPFLSRFARQGATLANFYAEGRPSQPNYIAMTSGSLHGVGTNDNVDLNVRHIGDLLEAKGRSWKVYAEGFPGNCFQGRKSGSYYRKHNPFISYVNVQKDPKRCSRIVNADEFASDVRNNSLADYSFYIPDNNNNGHDTDIEYADRHLDKTFSPMLSNTRAMQDMLFVITFDEGAMFGGNHIYTAFQGPNVVPGSSSNQKHNHYSLLRTIEDAWDLGNLGQNDARAQPITGVWR